jgi:hypothetical protein
MTSKRITELTGGLIFPDKWEINVIQPRPKSFRAVVKIDLLRSFGNEGEATVGDPRDFNTYRNVVDLLKDPNRERYLFFRTSLIPSIYLGLPLEDEQYDSQQDVCSFVNEI